MVPQIVERRHLGFASCSNMLFRSGRTSWRWRRATASFRLRESTRRLRRTGRPSWRASFLGGQINFFLSVLAQRDISLLLRTKLMRQFSRRSAFIFVCALTTRLQFVVEDQAHAPVLYEVSLNFCLCSHNVTAFCCWRPSSRTSSLGGQLKFLSVLAQRDCILLLKTKLTHQFSMRSV